MIGANLVFLNKEQTVNKLKVTNVSQEILPVIKWHRFM